MVEISGIFSTTFQNSVLQEPTIAYTKKMFFFLNFGTCTRNGSFGAILVKTWLKNFRG